MLRFRNITYEVLCMSGMFLGMFRFAQNIKFSIQGETRCNLYIFSGVFMF